jgi:uncharacterized protein
MAKKLLAFLFTLSILSVAEQLPEPQGLVSDFAGKLSPATKERLETLLRNFRDRSGGIEVAVVITTFDNLGGYPVEDYALRLARGWGIGGGSDKAGLLLLVAIKGQDQQGIYHGVTRLEVSRHLEGDIPDGLAGAIISRMRDDFRAGRFDQAITAGVQVLLATLSASRGISLDGVDQKYAYSPPAKTSFAALLVLLGLIVLLVVFIAMIKSTKSRSGRYGRRADSDWFIWPIFFGGGGPGGFGGYGGGYSSSSDSGDFGGFSGGGDFGGGGASDNW